MTDRQFLNGMWDKVKSLEAAEQELLAAKQHSRRLRRSEFIRSAAVLLALPAALLITLAFGDKTNTAAWLILPALPALVAALLYDNKEYKADDNSAKGVQNYGGI